MTALCTFLRPAVLAIAFALVPAAAMAQPPSWFTDEIKSMTADGGRWIADNSAFKSESEPYQSYAIEWKAGFDGQTMTGRLFGLKGDVETPTFWEYRQYWHPGRSEAVLDQFGWGGVVGAGAMTRDGAVTVTDQTFYQPDGTSRREGHRASFRDGDTHVTESFDIIDGAWSPRRVYVWKRQKAGAD